jgi:Domain of unknown function (DUF4838)
MFFIRKGIMQVVAIITIIQSGVIAAEQYKNIDESFYDQSQLSGIKDYKKFVKGQDVLFLTKNNKTDYNIYVDGKASKSEKFAAQTLADYLKRVSGVDFLIVNSLRNAKKIIAVGPEAAKKIAPDLVPNFSVLGQDGIVIKTDGQNLILTGAPEARRGTVYAVVTFLEKIGCRWWTKDDTFVPSKSELKIPRYNIQYRPALKYRELFCYNMKDYPVYNKLNGNCYKIPESRGGKVNYAGPYFVHTFSLIVPPQKYFASHPEWFAEINGKRKAGKWDGKSKGHANSCQLCLSNKELLAFVIKKVKGYLANAKPDTIVSVSQSDGAMPCKCAECVAIEKEEGGPAGPIVRFANAVADGIKDDYPQAKIETLSYNYSKKPIAITKPRDNVQIKLCSFNNRYLATFDSSANKDFYNDFKGWSKLTSNLFMWDYTTNFRNYLSPFPNLYLTPHNIRLSVKNNVKGIMLQGVYNTAGGDMKDLKNWVFAKILWDQKLDEKALIKEFVYGYYKEAAPYIMKYLGLLYGSDPMEKHYMRLTFLKNAYSILLEGRSATKNKPAIRRKLELAFAPVLNMIMINWSLLKQECADKSWPFPSSPAKVADEFVRVCKENNVSYIEEHKTTPEKWAKKYRVEQKLGKEAEEFKHIAQGDKLSIQDSAFRFYKKGVKVKVIKDAQASDGSAASMPGNHKDWAVQVDLSAMPKKNGYSGKWKVYVAAKVIKKGQAKGSGMSAGVYDMGSRKVIARYVPNLKKCDSDKYKLHLIGSVTPGSQYIYVSPTNNPKNVKEVIIDRIMLVRDK